MEEINNSLASKSNSIPTASVSNNTEKLSTIQYRQVCWNLPKPCEPALELIENKIIRIIGLVNLLVFIYITIC